MTKNLFLVCIIILGVGCTKDDSAPSYPPEPHIEFVDATLHYNDRDQDSLVIKINYRDGDGDLGLTIEDRQQYPFHEATYFNRVPPHEAIYDIKNFEGELLQLGDKPNGLDTLPEYNCIDYRIMRPLNSSTYSYDTVFWVINENNRNYLLDFFFQSEGKYEHFDFKKETCVSTWGIFTPVTVAGSPFVIDKHSLWEGTITYTFRALDIRGLFQDADIIKLKIRIRDRSLNLSNMVESPDIYLRK